MPRPSRLGLTTEDTGVYALRVPRDLLAAWKAFAASNGDTAQEALRGTMRRLLGWPAVRPKEPTPVLPGKLTAVPMVERGTKVRTEIQLTQSEHKALAAVADKSECSIQYWVVALIRAALTRGQVLGGTELKALGEANYQLMAVGRNLNQIAHAINADATGNAHQLTPQILAALQKQIEVTRNATHAVIEACSERWELR